MALYKSYDQEALDAQYNLRARHADIIEDYFAKWRNDSATARAGLWHWADVPFVALPNAPDPNAPENDDAPAYTLDLFRAEGTAGPAPIMVFIHGGYWQFLDKDHFSFPAAPFVADGIHFVSINYPLAPSVPIAEIVEACRAAVAWVWRNAASFGGDNTRMYVSGHSAGGHLTAAMAATDWAAWAPDLPTDLVKGAQAISGLYELEPIRLCFLNEGVRLTEADVAAHSPIRQRPPHPVKMQCVVGGGETDEFHAQQAAFAEAWQADGHAVETLVPPGLNHFDILDALTDPQGALYRAARSLMG